MRLPLGILSGMGFIGAGAILRKGSLVRGLTTAATLWFVTVLGLCFGGGQRALGLAVLALGVLILEGLKSLESRWKQDRHATLSLTVEGDGLTEDELTVTLQADGYEVRPWTVAYLDTPATLYLFRRNVPIVFLVGFLVTFVCTAHKLEGANE
jgi:putative Mg2+ transporter-C (MgtC) family protein